MAKPIDQLIKEQLGNLMFQIAILNSQLSAKDEEIEKLKAAIPKE